MSGALSLAILLSAFTLYSSAEDTEPTYCVSDHFSKLKYNHNGVEKERIPANEIGTCTHVAMSMLLSFYDFYWNDAFIPTIYESDGTNHQMGWENGIYNSTTNSVVETFNANPEASAWSNWAGDFESFASYNNMYYLQPYLLNIAQSETLTGAVGIVGMLDFEVVRVLETYLSMRGLGPEQGVEVHIEYGFPNINDPNASRETLFDTIKNQIENGNPVIFMGLDYIDCAPEFIDGDSFNIYAHAMLAYDVVQNNGIEDIVMHTGWNDYIVDDYDDEKQYFNSTPYINCNSAVWIEIDEDKMPHQCKDRYYDIATGVGYCTCQVYSTHPEHNNNNHIFLDKYDSNNHFSGCHCGIETNIIPHTLHYTSSNSSEHYQYCTNCYYSSFVEHDFSIPTTPLQTGGHGLKCACGYVGDEGEAHYYHSYTKNNKTSHYVYCECGYQIGTSRHVVPIGGIGFKLCIYCGERIDTSIIITPVPGTNSVSMRYITEAGSYVDANGIIYLVPSDLELVMAGELDIYALVENGGDLVTQ